MHQPVALEVVPNVLRVLIVVLVLPRVTTVSQALLSAVWDRRYAPVVPLAHIPMVQDKQPAHHVQEDFIPVRVQRAARCVQWGHTV